MANNCDNYLRVDCDRETFERIQDLLTDKDTQEFTLYPLLGDEDRFGYVNRAKNLLQKKSYANSQMLRAASTILNTEKDLMQIIGTKGVYAPAGSWDAQAIFFDSDGSAPVKAMELLSDLFPAAKFELLYCEPGNAFAGKAIAKNGKLKYQEHDSNSKKGRAIVKEMTGDANFYDTEDDD